MVKIVVWSIFISTILLLDATNVAETATIGKMCVNFSQNCFTRFLVYGIRSVIEYLLILFLAGACGIAKKAFVKTL